MNHNPDEWYMALNALPKLFKRKARSSSRLGRESDTPAQCERCLALLIEGASLAMPEVDPEKYREFRKAATGIAIKFSEENFEIYTLSGIQAVLHEFAAYRKSIDAAFLDRESSWRELASMLFRELIGHSQLDMTSVSVTPLLQSINGAKTSVDIQQVSVRIQDLIKSKEKHNSFRVASISDVDAHGVGIEQASGLRSHKAAAEHLEKFITTGTSGFVAVFRLSCLDIIGERFGLNALQDSIMTVSAFLLDHLDSKDAIYHWNNNSLLAVIETPANRQIVFASLERIVNENRDTLIRVGDRMVMLRIPLSFTLTPISQFREADDLHRFALEA